MRTGFQRLLAVTAFIAAWPGIAGADDRSEYNQRAAALFTSLFQTLDRDMSGSVTRSEAQGDLTFMPRFDDMDINRDGTVTLEELQRFVRVTFEVTSSLADSSVAPSSEPGSSVPGKANQGRRARP